MLQPPDSTAGLGRCLEQIGCTIKAKSASEGGNNLLSKALLLRLVFPNTIEAQEAIMAVKKTAKMRRSPADIKKAWQKLEPELARQRAERERQGETFTSITREEFEEKLKRVKSPMIVSQSWNNSAPPGGTINYSVGVLNPDPITWNNLAVSVSIGNLNPIVSNDEFLTSFDARFPTYAKPATLGFSLAPGASATQSFQVKIPAGVEKTGYFGNSALLQIVFHDVGKHLDRACFFFDVV